MTKKEFLSKTLAILGKDWALAQVMQILLENNELNDEFMDKLIALIQEFMEKIEDKETKEKMKKGLHVIQALKGKEMKEKEMDEKDLDQLEDLLKNVA